MEKDKKNEKSKKNLKNLEKIIEEKFKKYKIIIIILFITVILGIFISMKFSKKPELSINEVNSTLTEKKNIAFLQTYKYPYCGVIPKYKDKDKEKNEKNIEYYIAYKGNITAGVNFNKIKVELNKENNVIEIIIPEIIIEKADIKTTDILKIKKVNTEKHSKMIEEMCKNDLENKVKNNKQFKECAKENAKNSIKNLLTPLADKYGYKIEIK